jgi:hypothetical protein
MSENKMQQVSVTPEQAAKMYGLGAGTLANMRSQKKGPRFYKVGKKVLYRIEDLERWLFDEPVMTIDHHRFEH